MLSWIGTFALIFATMFRSFTNNHAVDLLLTFVGCSAWALEGIRLKNTPLVLTNAFCVLMIIIGSLFLT